MKEALREKLARGIMITLAALIVFVGGSLSLFGCAFIPSTIHDIQIAGNVCISPRSGYWYNLAQDLDFSIDGKRYTVPHGFHTDLASIPRFYWSILSPTKSEFMVASVVHDYLYQCPAGLSRKTIDDVFYCALRKQGSSVYTSYKMYVAVRIFGAKHYRENGLCPERENEESKGN